MRKREYLHFKKKDKHEGKCQAAEMKCSRCVKERRELDNTEDNDKRKALHDKWKVIEENDKII